MKRYLTLKALIFTVLTTMPCLLVGFWFLRQPAIAVDHVVDPVTYRIGEVLVQFTTSAEVYRVLIDETSDIASVVELYRANPDVAWAEPNYLVRQTAFPNDPLLRRQWYLTTIEARSAWSRVLLERERTREDYQPVIAILDTGVDVHHPDLESVIWQNADERLDDQRDNDRNGFTDDRIGWDFVDNDNQPEPDMYDGVDVDSSMHGTLVAAIAGAASHNKEGVAGVSWFSRIMPLRVLDEQGSGDVYSVIQGIDYAMSNGVDIINMSFVSDRESKALGQAIQQANDAGIIVVAAVGNGDRATNALDTKDNPTFPACFDRLTERNDVIAVASVGKNFIKSDFSNYGDCVDIVAPGEDFFTAQISGTGTEAYGGWWSGTSLAAPLVSGSLALLKALRPDITAEELKSYILNTTIPVDDVNKKYSGKLGSGQLNVANAVSAILGGTFNSQRTVATMVIALDASATPQVRVIGVDGRLQYAFYPFHPLYKGEVAVATGNVLHDAADEIIVTAGRGGGPQIRIFDQRGTVLKQFFADDQSKRFGAAAVVGDINSDGLGEIVVSSNPGDQPWVKIFDGEGMLLKSFVPFDARYRGGVSVAIVQSGNGAAELLVTRLTGSQEVKRYSASGVLLGTFVLGQAQEKFDMRIQSADIDNDGISEIFALRVGASRSAIYIYSPDGVLIRSFEASMVKSQSNPVLRVGPIARGGDVVIALGAASGEPGLVRTFTTSGELYAEFYAHHVGYRGGVLAAPLVR